MTIRHALRGSRWLPLVAFALGCSTPIGSFGLISNHDLGLDPQVIAEEVSGKSCAYHALGFIPIGGKWNPSPIDAMQDILAQVPDGNLLTNVSIYNETIYTVLYARNCIRVEADVEKIR
jgi:hypothetical protein